MHRPTLAAAAIAALAFAVPAHAKTARCVIDSEGTSYSGPCQFIAGKGGTFTVTPIGGRSFAGGALSITVFVVTPGVAEVRGLTDAGINSRWGRARRVPRDRACWAGEDFTICVY